MRKKICCICHMTNKSGGWSKIATNPMEEFEHGLCPNCFVKTLEKVSKIYSPVSAQMQAASRLTAPSEI